MTGVARPRSIMILLAFLFTALCHASDYLSLDPFTSDILFSLDQNIQGLSQPIHHRFESLPVKDKARGGYITQAWQDVLGPQAKVYFPGKLDKNELLRWQQLKSWENRNIYRWYHGIETLFPGRMFFVGYSTLQPEHMRLHNIVTTPPKMPCKFLAMKWCDKPFWANTCTCRMMPMIFSKKPGFLVGDCKRRAGEEIEIMKLRAARLEIGATILRLNQITNA